MRTLLSNRDATDLAQVRRFIVGTLSTDQAENIGETIYVDGTAGSNAFDGKSPDRAKLTITAALAVAVAGDVVAVFPGTYAEHLTMAVANVSLVGLGDEPVKTLISSPAVTATPLLTISAVGCTVANLRFTQGEVTDPSCILVNQVSETFIENCDFVLGAACALLIGVEILGAPTTAFCNTVRGCFFSGCTMGIVLVEIANTMPLNTYVKNCTFQRLITSDISDLGVAHVIDGIFIEDCNFRTVSATMLNLHGAAHTGTLYGCCCPGAWSHAGGVNTAALILTARCYTVAGVSGAAPA